MHFRLAPNSFGNTFDLFCSSRVQPALLGNVSHIFRFPRVQPDIHRRHYLPFSLPKGRVAKGICFCDLSETERKQFCDWLPELTVFLSM